MRLIVKHNDGRALDIAVVPFRVLERNVVILT